LLRVGYVSCGVIAVGSLGPWATLGPISADGLDGDGVLTLILASIAATLLWRWSGSAARWKLICAIVAGGFATAITLYDTVNISTVLSGAASVGWGLILALILTPRSCADGRSGTNRLCMRWAGEDSNLRPTDYERRAGFRLSPAASAFPL